jgi:4-hydroxy-3-polyprenylbenzoate decarboxylase
LHETNTSVEEVESMASHVYGHRDIGAAIASGSFKTMGMVIAPCSIKTLSSVANSYNDNLLTRAADVTLKEGRQLAILVRETPLHVGHLRLMLATAEIGATIVPPIPAFYNLPQTLDDVVNHTIGRVLDRFGINHTLVEEWKGTRHSDSLGPD